MKKFVSLMLLATLCCASAFATQYTDSSDNYAHEDGEGGTYYSWESGDNGGDGFGPWTIATTSGDNGWAGCGIWNPSANEFQGTWAGKTRAFGMIGKGAGFSVTAARSFRAALATGDSFSLEMAVNWDANIDGAHKGFVLTAGGSDIIEINHGNYPGPVYVNGSTWDGNGVLTNAGVYPMVWTFTAKDEVTIEVVVSDRADPDHFATNELTVSTSAIDGFRLQSVAQDNQDEDRRQSYYDNFVLDVSGELADLVTLGFESGEWAVTNATQTLHYTLSRSPAAGELAVTISSSDESFVASTNVTFAAGEATVAFELAATLTGNGNFATITASGANCNPASYDVSGPNFSINQWNGTAGDNISTIKVGESSTGYINQNKGGLDIDSSLITVGSSDSDVLTAAAKDDWSGDPDDFYGQYGVTGTGAGSAVVSVSYDGVWMVNSDPFTVKAYGIALSGSTKLAIGEEKSVTVTAVGLNNMPLLVTSGDETVLLVGGVDDDGCITPDSDDWTGSFTMTGVAAGTATITVWEEGNDFTATLDVTVAEAPDYSNAIAYDEASFYAEGWTLDATGIGSDKFQPWQVYQKDAEWGDVNIADETYGGITEDILENGKAFGLYANGGDGNYKLVRPFVNDLAAGQTASIDFVQSDAANSRFIQFYRWWDGVAYVRFEVWQSGGTLGVNIEGVDGPDLSAWALSDGAKRTVTASIALADDQSAYTLSLEGSDGLSWSTTVPTSAENWGDGIQGLLVGAWQSGADFFFNRLAIVGAGSGGETVEIPMDTLSFSGDGFSFTVPDGYTIAKVEYATELENGSWKFENEATYAVAEGTATVTLPDEDNAIFRVTFQK